MRIVIVQYGVLHDRYAELQIGGKETYYAQKYSVDFVTQLAEQSEFVGVCGVLGDTADEVQLTKTLHSACIPAINGAVDAPKVIKLLEKWRPDRLILQAPVRPILRWAQKNNIDTLPLLADSFEEKRISRKIGAFLLGRQLNSPSIRAVGNHNIPASLSLKHIGVDADKIYPWDWPHELRPENHPVKVLSDEPPSLIYVGSLSVAKGVSDCINAARILHADGMVFSMTLIGGGEFLKDARKLVSHLHLDDLINLTGRLSHDEVVEHLTTATISLVPSHHIYPEGLPMTIYEALATRTPLAISDHPMFQLYFNKSLATRMAPQKNPDALAAAIQALLNDKDAYHAASQATDALWHKVKCDLTWGALIKAWLDTSHYGLSSVRNFALDREIATLK